MRPRGASLPDEARLGGGLGCESRAGGRVCEAPGVGLSRVAGSLEADGRRESPGERPPHSKSVRAELVRALVIEALQAILDEGRPADVVLDRLLRAHRDLDSAERAAVARRTLGITCLRGRLDFILEALVPGWRGEPHRHRIAAYAQTEEHLDAQAAARAAGLTRMPELGEPLWPADPVARLAAERSLPGWLAQLWQEELGLQADALARATNRPGPVALRANLLKTTRERLIQDLAAEGIDALAGAHSPLAAVVQGRANLFGSPLWRAGHFEVQDEASQLVAQWCGARPGEKVVDYCAGAGGKTLALAAAMENRGELWALDIEGVRLHQLTARVERAGVVCARWMRIESGSVPGAAAGADCVLVDAPCSALGTLRRSPDARWRIGPEEVAAFPARQLEILGCASLLARPGGRLVYATCTLHGAENRGVVERFLAAAPQFSLDGAPLEVAPHTHGTDGFFAVAMRRAFTRTARTSFPRSEFGGWPR